MTTEFEDEAILDKFPSIVPTSSITVSDEAHEFEVLNAGDPGESITYEYLLNKAPVIRVEEVRDSDGIVYEKGTDYDVIDADGDGELDTIDWDVGGERPADNTQFFVTYVCISVISRYVGAYDSELERVNDEVFDVITSRYVDLATGDELDQIGAMFGNIGKRRGRSDQNYRNFLRSIVESFKGRGTVNGIVFTIAAGVNVDDSEVSIIEDLTENAYQIQLEDWAPHSTEAILNLAELADPSGVELLQPIFYLLSEGQIGVEGSGTESTVFIDIAEGVIEFDGDDMQLATFFVTPDGTFRIVGIDTSSQTVSTVGLSSGYLSDGYLPGDTNDEITTGLGSGNLGSGTLGPDAPASGLGSGSLGSGNLDGN